MTTVWERLELRLRMDGGRARHPAISRVDRRVERAIAALPDSIADAALRRVSRAADNSRLWFATSAVLFLTGPAGRRAAVRSLAGLGLASAVANQLGKRAFGGPRPDLQYVPLGRQLRRTPTSGAFPSGHAATAAAFATGVALEWPAAGAIVVPVAVSVAYSRLHVGAHWFSDVAGGVLLGTGVSLFGAVSRRCVQTVRLAGLPRFAWNSPPAVRGSREHRRSGTLCA